MIDDLSKSIKANLYERATSPLFGTFAVAWCIWNYKTLFVLASSMDVDDKFNYIETFIYTGAWDCIWQVAFYPILSAVAFIFLYPIPAKFVYEYWHNRQRELRVIKQRIEDETPLTIEESRAIRRDFYKLESQYDAELSRKDAEIDKLKDFSRGLEEKLEEIRASSQKAVRPKKVTPKKVASKKVPSSDFNPPNEEQMEILIDIAKEGGAVSEYYVHNKYSFDRVKLEYYLEDLEDKNLITSGFVSSTIGEGYELTTKGKQLMVETGVVK